MVEMSVVRMKLDYVGARKAVTHQWEMERGQNLVWISRNGEQEEWQDQTFSRSLLKVPIGPDCLPVP
jgi:hypothetical protein